MISIDRVSGVVVDASKSAYVRQRPVSIDAVSITDRFWAPRIKRNREVTLTSQYKQLWETGRFDNLLRVAGKYDGPFQGRYFNDTDVYKWLEAAAWSLLTEPNDQLLARIDEAIVIIGEAQREDGYLNSYFAVERADERWTNHDLHEMYCAGHLFQAAVAHYRATGSRKLIDISAQMADHIDSVFGPEGTGKRIGTDGHPEVEMGLVELYRVTGEKRYLDLAKFLVDVRGHGVLGDAYHRFGRKYHQDHEPFRELDEIVGHAVRAVYLNAGVADIYAETGEAALLEALQRLWVNMTGRKMYVSGGLGSRYEGEAFGEDYELPNRLAYTETCAAIGSIMWAWRMLMIEGDARYADVIELQLYNAMLSGVSLDGETYFYQNPLSDEGHHRRAPWFVTACCPPNVARTLSALPGYVYTVSDSEIWVHLYLENDAEIPVGNQVVRIKQTGSYPWSGEVTFTLESAGEFGLQLRVPGWYRGGGSVSINGVETGQKLVAGTYSPVRRSWSAGDTVTLTLPMPIRQVASHPYVSENEGRVAILRGPMLFCMEDADNPEVDPRDVVLDRGTTFGDPYHADLLDGVVTLSANVSAVKPESTWNRELYRDGETADGAKNNVPITLVPYYAWANRQPGRMRVWLKTE